MPTDQTLDLVALECDVSKLNHFRYGQMRNGIILTTDHGSWQWLTKTDFVSFLAGTLNEESGPFQDLCDKGFLRSHLDLEQCAQHVRQRKNFLGVGPVLHQIHLRDAHGALALDTANALINHMMQSTSPTLHVELIHPDAPVDQDLLQFLIDFTLEKNRYEQKQLEWTLRLPVKRLTPAISQKIIDNDGALHLEMHGTPELHDQTASTPYDVVKSHIERFLGFASDSAPEIRATMSVGRKHLTHIEDSLKALSDVGIKTVFLEPRTTGEEAIAPSEFKAFYTAALQWLLHNDALREGHAITIASTILNNVPPPNPSARMPAGSGLSVHGYDTLGRIYPNAQAAQSAERTLLLGTVGTSSYEDTMAHPNLKAIAAASVLDCIPVFSQHWATPFLSVDPVACYVQTGDLFEKLPTSTRVQVEIARVEALFDILLSDDVAPMNRLENWVQTGLK